MRAKTVGFAIADEDRELLDKMVAKYGDGNRSEFLRQALKMMARREMAERINDLRSELREQNGGSFLSHEEIMELVYKVKGKQIV
jgi:predicted transcriptional regulator